MVNYHNKYAGERLPYVAPEFRTVEELMLMQSKGKSLTRDEKNRVAAYAEQKRKQKNV